MIHKPLWFEAQFDNTDLTLLVVACAESTLGSWHFRRITFCRTDSILCETFDLYWWAVKPHRKLLTPGVGPKMVAEAAG